MKKFTFVSLIVLTIVIVTATLFRSEERKLETFTIETGYDPMAMVKTDGFMRGQRTVLVPVMGQEIRRVSFLVEAEVIDAVIAKLQTVTHSVNLKGNSNEKLAWSLDRKGAQASLKIYRVKAEIWPRPQGC